MICISCDGTTYTIIRRFDYEFNLIREIFGDFCIFCSTRKSLGTTEPNPWFHTSQACFAWQVPAGPEDQFLDKYLKLGTVRIMGQYEIAIVLWVSNMVSIGTYTSYIVMDIYRRLW